MKIVVMLISMLYSLNCLGEHVVMAISNGTYDVTLNDSYELNSDNFYLIKEEVIYTQRTPASFDIIEFTESNASDNQVIYDENSSDDSNEVRSYIYERYIRPYK